MIAAARTRAARVLAFAGGSDDWVVSAHHPDRRRAPQPRPGRVLEDRMRAALAWNVFRTLAGIDPSRWLRPLHARIFGFDERYRAPEWLDVRLWVPVPAPGLGTAAEIVDVVLESEAAVWAFLTAFERDVIVGAGDVDGPDPVLRTTMAAARLAAGRRLFVGLLASPSGTAPVGERLVRRYAASPALLHSRLRPHVAAPDLGGLGVGRWETCATVLAACHASPAVAAPEGQAALRCLRWLSANGIARDG